MPETKDKPTNTREFDSEELAMAFIEGVEYVNDSDLTVELAGYDKPKGQWVVNIYDAGESSRDL